MPDRPANPPPDTPAARPAKMTMHTVFERLGFMQGVTEQHERRIAVSEDMIHTLAGEVTSIKTLITEYQEQVKQAMARQQALVESLGEAISYITNKLTTSQAQDDKFNAFLTKQDAQTAAVAKALEDKTAKEVSDRLRARQQFREVARGITGMLSVLMAALITVLAGRINARLGETLAPFALAVLAIALIAAGVLLWKSKGVSDT